MPTALTTPATGATTRSPAHHRPSEPQTPTSRPARRTPSTPTTGSVWPATGSVWPATDTGRVLVLIDDALARRAIDAALRAEGLAARATADTASAEVLMRSYRPTVMLVGARHLPRALAHRAVTDTDVRLVVHGADAATRLDALRHGADDALAPDCSPAEIALRCVGLARRTEPHRATVADRRVRLGRVTIDLGRRTIAVDGSEIAATRLEFDLFAELCRHPTEVCTRTQLIESVWGPSWVGDPHVVDVHLSNLRRKVRDRAPDLQLLSTVRGVGFRLSDASVQCPEAPTATQAEHTDDASVGR